MTQASGLVIGAERQDNDVNVRWQRSRSVSTGCLRHIRLQNDIKKNFWWDRIAIQRLSEKSTRRCPSHISNFTGATRNCAVYGEGLFQKYNIVTRNANVRLAANQTKTGHDFCGKSDFTKTTTTTSPVHMNSYLLFQSFQPTSYFIYFKQMAEVSNNYTLKKQQLYIEKPTEKKHFTKVTNLSKWRSICTQ